MKYPRNESLEISKTYQTTCLSWLGFGIWQDSQTRFLQLANPLSVGKGRHEEDGDDKSQLRMDSSSLRVFGEVSFRWWCRMLQQPPPQWCRNSRSSRFFQTDHSMRSSGSASFHVMYARRDLGPRKKARDEQKSHNHLLCCIYDGASKGCYLEYLSMEENSIQPQTTRGKKWCTFQTINLSENSIFCGFWPKFSAAKLYWFH